MANEEDLIVALLRKGFPVGVIVKKAGVPLHIVRKLQTTWAPETRKSQGRVMLTRRRVKKQRVSLQTPLQWEGKWVEVSRETDSDGNVVSMKVEVSE